MLYKQNTSRRSFVKRTCLFTGLFSFCPLYFIESGMSQQNLTLNKWSKEAFFYTPTPRGVKCDLCPNNCMLQDGKTGDCKNRIGIGNKVFSIGYGNPCSIHIDPIEKKPFYHFLPQSNAFSVGVAGCNFTCLNCQNWEISQRSPDKVKHYDLLPVDLIEQVKISKAQSIAYTYTEPVTFYEYMYDSAVLAKENNIYNLLISNGYVHEKPLRQLVKVIDAANIDLKAFSNDVYLKLNGGSLNPVLRSLQILKDSGVWLEITNLLIPGYTTDLDMIKKMCVWLTQNGFADTPLHFSRFYPAYRLSNVQPTPENVLLEARKIALNEGIKYVYIGNLPKSGYEDTVCPSCHKTLIARNGYTILENKVINGACSYCKTKISGKYN
jgi:pyruvate formate lyase activating enzyme